MLTSEAGYDINGKAVRAYQVMEVQPNGELIKKAQFSPAERVAAFDQCAELNSKWNYGGIEYFVRTIRFA